MLDRQAFWRLYEAMSIPARAGHDCLAEGHGSLDCPHTESVQSLRNAAGDLLTVLQAAPGTACLTTTLGSPACSPPPLRKDDRMITLEEQITEARRELALRKQCYPQWVKSGKLDAQDAYHQLQCMDAIVRTLMRLDAEQRQMSLFEHTTP